MMVFFIIAASLVVIILSLALFTEEAGLGIIGILVGAGIFLWAIISLHTFEAVPYERTLEIYTVDYRDGRQTQHYLDGATVNQVLDGVYYNPDEWHVVTSYEAGWNLGIWHTSYTKEIKRKQQ